MSDKKKMQLGMNPSTASNRLVKDVLWKLIQQTGQDACCKCGEPMSRETFSIEHVIPWLDSEDPVGLYFDLENISFSHLRCNILDGVSKPRRYMTEEERLEGERVYRREYKRRNYTPEKRRDIYLRTGQ